ncbi:DUF6301 family protein [Nocardia sp. NPDC127526]|uniref:DUF6301 family protein n=1 Tax=Nocardia sp. NPDC127526 TaxID=3345393 RepID=UPI003629DF05
MREWRALTDTELVELATRLRSLEWSWNLADAPQLVADFGWKLNNTLSELVKFDSGFGRSTGSVSSLGGRAAEISVQVTSYAEEDAAGRARIVDAFAGYTAALTDAFGAPSARIPGKYPEIRWVHGETTLRLIALSVAVDLGLMTNEGLARHDEIVRLQEQGLI